MISGMASLLIDYPDQTAVNKTSFMQQLITYARQHTRGKVTNGTAPWVGEVTCSLASLAKTHKIG
jgi:hypothetical protein